MAFLKWLFRLVLGIALDRLDEKQTKRKAEEVDRLEMDLDLSEHARQIERQAHEETNKPLSGSLSDRLRDGL